MKKYNPTIIQKLFIVLLFFSAISCKNDFNKPKTADHQEIRNYINHLIKRHQIPGVALAIVKNDSIILQENFGKANIEHNVDLKDSSIFRVYSLTKLPVAIAVFQLIEQKKLTLNDEIATYIDSLPNSWKVVTIQHLISHSSGLPAMRSFPNLEKLTEVEVKKLVFQENIQFNKGEKYDYNQTNFWLLQKIIEKVSGETFSNFILKNQFDNAQKNVFFSSNSKEIVKNRVTAYFPFRTGTIEIDHPTLVGNYMLAANGLNITLEEFLKWDKKLKTNQLLKQETKEKMWEMFSYSKSDKIFTNGWDKRVVNSHNSYGFSGSLVTAYRIFPNDKLSIIFLGNGLGNYFNIENIINHIASLLDEDIVDLNNRVFEKLLQPIVDADIHQFKKAFNDLWNNENFININFEQQINAVGYQLMNQRRMEKAIDVLAFNSLQFPKSANAFDSLAEAYYRNNNDSLAAKNYKIAINLGGTNGNAKQMLARLKK